jgi:hypothetical protein
MRGAISPLPNTPSWRHAQSKHRENFTFTFYLTEVIDYCYRTQDIMLSGVNPYAAFGIMRGTIESLEPAVRNFYMKSLLSSNY